MDRMQKYGQQQMLAPQPPYTEWTQKDYNANKIQVKRSRVTQTFLNTLYLLMAFPLGTCYFCFVILAISLLPLSLLIIGVPLTGGFLYLLWQLAVFERSFTRICLHVDIPPMATPRKTNLSWTQRLLTHLSQPVTWKSLLYLFIKFPLGVTTFYLTIVFLVLILIWHILIILIMFLIGPFIFLFVTFFVTEKPRQTTPKSSFVSVMLGSGWSRWPLYAINFMAVVSGQFARSMLGMSDQALRLARAEQLAEQEHAKAERAEQSRRELIINASHELRTPVASIRGHIESLMIACEESESAVPEPETLQKYLTIVHREVLRLGTLVDDILSVARAETNELRVTITAVEASEVVEEVYQTLAPLAKRERQILMIRKIEPHLPQVQADRQRLIQVLLNLIRNAITYTPDGGIVSIALQREDNEYIALLVSDTGIGIPPEDQQRIFERFYRTDASRARTSGGFGLGLAIVRDFVQAMGGSIAVKSTVGEGSTFRVLLHIV